MNHTIRYASLSLCLCLGPLVAEADSHAKSTMQLAEEKQCMACHTTGAEVPRAPGFESIAQKYTQEDAERLVQVVMTGGEDHWGSAEMPDMKERSEVTETQARQLVKWVLDMRSEKM